MNTEKRKENRQNTKAVGFSKFHPRRAKNHRLSGRTRKSPLPHRCAGKKKKKKEKGRARAILRSLAGAQKKEGSA